MPDLSRSERTRCALLPAMWGLDAADRMQAVRHGGAVWGEVLRAVRPSGGCVSARLKYGETLEAASENPRS